MKYILFADLYFPEGVIDVVAPILIPIYLVEKGIAVEIITFVAGVAILPWIIKFLWSGLIDKYSYLGRRIFVIIGSLIAIFCYILLAFIDPVDSLFLFTFVLFVSQIGQSFHDSTTDAWAIDISQKENRGKLTSSMNIGHYVGIGISAIILSYVADNYGFNFMFITAGIIILILLIIPIIFNDSKIGIKKEKVTPLLVNEFKDNKIRLVALFALFISVSSGFLMFVVPLFAKNILNLSTSQIGLLAGVVPLIVIPGSLLGGHISDKWGRKKAIYLLVIPSIFLIISIMFTTTLLFIAIPYFIVIFLNAGRWTSSSALYMDVTNEKIRATQYSTFNGLENFGLIISGMIAGTFLAILGYSNIFILIGLVLFIPLAILYFIKINNKSK